MNHAKQKKGQQQVFGGAGRRLIHHHITGTLPGLAGALRWPGGQSLVKIFLLSRWKMRLRARSSTCVMCVVLCGGSLWAHFWNLEIPQF